MDTLVAGQSYIMQVNYPKLLDVNSALFTGTGISGNPVGLAYDNSTTFINIQAIPEPAGTALAVGLVMVGLLGLRRGRR
ncbi:MAG: hypothetical protein PSU94_15400 [Lacunisphaera sp.]|nr:hypothetical protein [Lacunisphaera sp.]